MYYVGLFAVKENNEIFLGYKRFTGFTGLDLDHFIQSLEDWCWNNRSLDHGYLMKVERDTGQHMAAYEFDPDRDLGNRWRIVFV